MEMDELLKKIDKIEQKIDEIAAQNSKLATDYALVSQDVSRILEINRLIHSIEVRSAISEEKICVLNDQQTALDKKINYVQDDFNAKIQRLSNAGWSILILTLTQIIALIVMILHDKLLK